ncbi:MAG: D-alanyl-D-alanine carboxypeptidase family protein [bacterium]
MLKLKKNLDHYILTWKKLPRSRQLLALGALFLIILYPGQNYYQTLIIHPGVVSSYRLPPPPANQYPVSDGVPAPALSAQSIVVQDAHGKTLMFQKNPDISLLPASTTKIMTALVALDFYSLTDILVVQNEERAIGSTMKLVKNESITVENLLYGLLVDSGNDAALALADNYTGGYEGFVNAMNQKARSLHLDHTVYKNPSGVESYGHVTTARDLAVLASVAVENPIINRVMQTREITVTDITGKISHTMVNTNELLGEIDGLKGLKTGWTEHAGECLVSYVERSGHGVIIVVLNSLDRFGETTKLINWAFEHHSWQQPVL